MGKDFGIKFMEVYTNQKFSCGLQIFTIKTVRFLIVNLATKALLSVHVRMKHHNICGLLE